jgi:hypothetical protein
MISEIVLSAALRNNLLSLQKTQSSIDKVQQVLSTGLKVSSALDNPQNYFASESLKDRSSDLTRLLDGIGQSVQTIKAADAGVKALTRLVDQADSIVQSAREALTSGEVKASITGNAVSQHRLRSTLLAGAATRHPASPCRTARRDAVGRIRSRQGTRRYRRHGAAHVSVLAITQAYHSKNRHIGLHESRWCHL